jgi:hypothetical protein
LNGTRLAYSATMLRLKRTQRAIAVEKLPDVANIGLGVLVFGQFVDERQGVNLARQRRRRNLVDSGWSNTASRGREP